MFCFGISQIRADIEFVHPRYEVTEGEETRILLRQANSNADASETVQSELLVKWRDGPTAPVAARENALLGSRVVENYPETGWQLIRLPEGMNVEEGMRKYSAIVSVLKVDANRQRRINADVSIGTSLRIEADGVHALSTTTSGIVPNDPSFKSEQNLKLIGATNAWAVTTGSSNVVVAIIDTGIDYNHPDLAANMWRNPGETGLDAQGRDKATNGIDDDGDGYVDNVYGVNFVDNNGDPMDKGSPINGQQFYHGTAMAGLIGAVGNNGLGTCGVNWTVRLMALRVTSAQNTINDATLVRAFEYLLAEKRKGVNIRVSNNPYLFNPVNDRNAAVQEAFDALGREGVLNIIGAGNYSSDLDATPDYPVSFDSLTSLTVAASTSGDSLATGANFGATSVDLAAPAEGTITTYKGGAYGTVGGSSAACGQVAGSAALLAAAKPGITVDEMKSLLLGSVDTSSGLKGKVLSNGRLNIGRAMQMLNSETNMPIAIGMKPAGFVSDVYEDIRVDFNRPMDRSSTEAAFQTIPAVQGTFTWTNQNRSFLYRHPLPLLRTKYNCKVLATALDATGRALDGNYNRIADAAPNDDLSWSFRVALTNDDFSQAVTLTDLAGTYKGDSSFATIEAGETFLGSASNILASVWFQWKPSVSIWESFDLTSGSSFDSLLSVFQGDSLADLVLVSANDNYRPGTSAGRCSFPAKAGTTYYIEIAGKGNVDPFSGGFTLKWYPTPAPVISSFSPTNVISGTTVALVGTNFTGVTNIAINGRPAVFNTAGEKFPDVRLSIVVPPNATSGPISIETSHGSFTTTEQLRVLVAPRLSLLAKTGRIILSWPDTEAGFVVQATDTLGPGAGWAAADVTTDSSAIAGLKQVVDTNALAHARFYRLEAQ